MFYQSINKFRNFAKDKPLSLTGKIVYVTGSFDLLNFAHIEFLRKAKEQGDSLLVGLFSDETIREVKGNKYPILNVYSRAMNILAMEMVDDVVLNAPYDLNPEFITEFNVDIVAEGKVHYIKAQNSEEDNFRLIRDKVEVKIIDSGSDFSFSDQIDRIKQNSSHYKAIVDKKKAKLNDYYGQRSQNNQKEITN